MPNMSFTNMGPPNRLTDPHFIHSQKRDVPLLLGTWRSSTRSRPFPSRRPPRPPALASRRPSPPSCPSPRLASPPARSSPSRRSRTKRLARFRCVPPMTLDPGNGRRHRSGWRIGRAYRSSPSSEHLRARAFGVLASPLRRVVGRRRDTSPRKTETLKPFSSRTNFPSTLADLRPSQSTLSNSPATSASATR